MNKITYHGEGDYLIPDIYLKKENYKNDYCIGKYGKMRLEYLKEYNITTYNELRYNNKLRKHIVDTDMKAYKMLNTLIEQFKENENVTEELKARNQLEWVQCMNNIKNRVEEIIYNELIYV